MSELATNYEEIDAEGNVVDYDPYAEETDYDPYAEESEFDRDAFIISCASGEWGLKSLAMTGEYGTELFRQLTTRLLKHPDLENITEEDDDLVVEIGREVWDELLDELKPKSHFEDLREKFADEMLDGEDYAAVDVDDLRDRFYQESDKIPEDARFGSDITIIKDHLAPAWRHAVDAYQDEMVSTEEGRLYALFTSPISDDDRDEIYDEMLAMMEDRPRFPLVFTSPTRAYAGRETVITHYDPIVDDFLAFAKIDEMEREEFAITSVYTAMIRYLSRVESESLVDRVDDMRKRGMLHEMMTTIDADPVDSDEVFIHVDSDDSTDFYLVSEIPEDVLAEAVREIDDGALSDVSISVRVLPELETMTSVLRNDLREAGLEEWEQFPYIASGGRRPIRIESGEDLYMLYALEYPGEENDYDITRNVCCRVGIIGSRRDMCETASENLVEHILDGYYNIHRTPGQFARDLGKSAFTAIGRGLNAMFGR